MIVDKKADHQNSLTEKKKTITLKSPGNNQFVDDAESTDVSKAGDLTDKKKVSHGLGQAPVYDWTEVAYLFENGTIPEELL